MDSISPAYQSLPHPNRSSCYLRFTKRLALLFLMAAVCFCQNTGAQTRENIDRILAVIGNHVILHSDILIHSEVIKRTRHTILPTAEVFADTTEDQFRRKIFKENVIRQIVYAETVKLNLSEVAPELVDAAMLELKQTFVSQKEFERFCYLLGIREEQMTFLVRQRLICEAYIEKKIGLQVRINRRNYYNENKDRYPALPLEQIQDQVDKDLYREKLSAWLVDILRRTDIKIMEDMYKDALK